MDVGTLDEGWPWSKDAGPVNVWTKVPTTAAREIPWPVTDSPTDSPELGGGQGSGSHDLTTIVTLVAGTRATTSATTAPRIRDPVGAGATGSGVTPRYG